MRLTFEILFVFGNPGKISKGSLSCHTLGTEVSIKLKFGEVSVHIC